MTGTIDTVTAPYFHSENLSRVLGQAERTHG